jgi:hypothetical protein
MSEELTTAELKKACDAKLMEKTEAFRLQNTRVYDYIERLELENETLRKELARCRKKSAVKR